MELQPADSALFRTAIEGLKDMLSVAQLHITKAGLRISGMDAVHVVFVSYTLSAKDCTVLKAPMNVTIGLSLAVLAKVLAPIGASDTLTLKSTGEHLVVTLVNEKLKKKTVCNVPLLDLTIDELEIPELTYATTVEAKTADMAALFKEVGAFGDTVTLSLDADGFKASASNEMGAMTQVLEREEGRKMISTERVKPVGFGTKYLIAMLKSALSPQVRLQMNEETPMCVGYKVGTESSLVFHLAPKLGDEA